MSEERERQIARSIAQRGPATARAIGDALMRDPGEVERVLDRLARPGRFVIAGRDTHGAPLYAI